MAAVVLVVLGKATSNATVVFTRRRTCRDRSARRTAGAGAWPRRAPRRAPVAARSSITMCGRQEAARDVRRHRIREIELRRLEGHVLGRRSLDVREGTRAIAPARRERGEDRELQPRSGASASAISAGGFEHREHSQRADDRPRCRHGSAPEHVLEAEHVREPTRAARRSCCRRVATRTTRCRAARTTRRPAICARFDRGPRGRARP